MLARKRSLSRLDSPHGPLTPVMYLLSIGRPRSPHGRKRATGHLHYQASACAKVNRRISSVLNDLFCLVEASGVFADQRAEIRCLATEPKLDVLSEPKIRNQCQGRPRAGAKNQTRQRRVLLLPHHSKHRISSRCHRKTHTRNPQASLPLRLRTR